MKHGLVQHLCLYEQLSCDSRGTQQNCNNLCGSLPFYVQSLRETFDSNGIVLVYRYRITWVSGQLESVKLVSVVLRKCYFSLQIHDSSCLHFSTMLLVLFSCVLPPVGCNSVVGCQAPWAMHGLSYLLYCTANPKC